MSRLAKRVEKLEDRGGQGVIIVDGVCEWWPDEEQEAFVAAEVARQGGGPHDLVVLLMTYNWMREEWDVEA